TTSATVVVFQDGDGAGLDGIGFVWQIRWGDGRRIGFVRQNRFRGRGREGGRRGRRSAVTLRAALSSAHSPGGDAFGHVPCPVLRFLRHGEFGVDHDVTGFGVVLVVFEESDLPAAVV